MKYNNGTDLPFKHTEDWYETKMEEMNNYSEKVRGKETFRSVNDFAITWENTDGKNKTREMQYTLKHSQNRYVHKKMLAMEQMYDPEATMRSIQKMTTREFADKHTADIKKMYEDRRNAGDNPNEAKKFISQYWFGSK